MTLLYHDRFFQEHMTGGSHPETRERLRAVNDYLEHTQLIDRCTRPTWGPASEEQVTRLHDLLYLDYLKKFTAAAGGQIEADTVVSPKSYDVALYAAGAVCDAVQRVVRGEDKNALCLVRPPGHHALREGAMGFCLLNNIAIGAREATDALGVDRVLIVDWDVHHGNGTQAMFWRNERVGFFSIHRFPFYPGSGAADETGEGAGLGYTVNVPIAYRGAPDNFRAAFRSRLEKFADHVRPQLVMISAGFDAHADDPIGSLSLESEDFAEMTRIVQQIADTHAQGRIVSVLEGGYNPLRLAESVGLHLTELLNQR